MIRPLAAFLHALDAARTAGTLARTVRVLGRQLDNAHLLAASEGARADRAEAERDHAEAYAAQLEASIRDWEHDSGAEPNLPDLTDAAPPLATPDPLRETDYHRDRADSLMRTLHATEATVLDLRAACARTERELVEARAQLRQTEAAAGAHVATIEALREQIATAHRAAHAPARSTKDQAWERLRTEATAAVEAYENTDCGETFEPVFAALDEALAGLATVEEDEPAEQIPGVAAASPYAIWSAEYDAIEAARATAGTDDPPPTRPSERTATRTT